MSIKFSLTLYVHSKASNSSSFGTASNNTKILSILGRNYIDYKCRIRSHHLTIDGNILRRMVLCVFLVAYKARMWITIHGDRKLSFRAILADHSISFPLDYRFIHICIYTTLYYLLAKRLTCQICFRTYTKSVWINLIARQKKYLNLIGIPASWISTCPFTYVKAHLHWRFLNILGRMQFWRRKIYSVLIFLKYAFADQFSTLFKHIYGHRLPKVWTI